MVCQVDTKLNQAYPKLVLVIQDGMMFSTHFFLIKRLVYFITYITTKCYYRSKLTKQAHRRC